MATTNKRTRADKVAKEAAGFVVVKGKVLNLKGELKLKKFYLGRDLAEAKLKKAAIELAWAEVVAAGETTWTEPALDKLESQGIIPPRKPQLKANEALQLFHDPLTTTELKPFVDDAGRMKPEAAPMAADFMARKIYGRLDVRAKLYDAILKQALTDPLPTIERVAKLFGWSNKEAAQFLFSVDGNVSLSPVGYNANEPTKASPRAKEALQDLIEGETVENGND